MIMIIIMINRQLRLNRWNNAMSHEIFAYIRFLISYYLNHHIWEK